MSTIAVRPVLPQDEIFLYDLYFAVRGPEFDAAIGITPAQKDHLLRIQWQGQLYTYTQRYPNSCYHVVLLDSKPVGRLWVAPLERELHLVDIAVHPSVQRKGIGRVLIQRLQQEAAKAHLPIGCTVLKFNPRSLQFHLSLGFSIIREDEVNYFMEWRPIPIV